MENEQNETINIQDIFPELQPVSKTPSMFMVNGIGTNVYGKRDYHAQTGAYLKTYCLAIFFIPVLALRAYRVCDAQGGGWHFLGREPLSGFAKGWNYLLLSSIIGLISLGSWASYTNSPEYRAKQNLAKAETYMQEGNVLSAVDSYISVAKSHTSHAQTGRQKLNDLIANLDKQPLNDVEKIVNVFKRNYFKSCNEALSAQLTKLVEKNAQSEPLISYKLYKLANDLAQKKQDNLKLQQQLLEAIVQQNPQQTQYASELAVIYEQQKRWQDCENILAPHGEKLIPYEGARILGQIYAQKGKLEQSDALLVPYVNRGINELNKIEKEYDTVWRASQDQALWLFNNNYRYDTTTPKEELRKRFQVFFQQHLKKDPKVQAKLEEYREAVQIVHVAMDLGMVKLYLARTEKQENTRAKKLQEVEKLFLSIQSAAGASDRYQLTLGQVYYWMGKKDAGKQQFAEFLKQNAGNAEKSLQLAKIYRELGDGEEALKLAKEAYEQSTSEDDKKIAAEICAVSAVSTDEKISWLKKTDLTSPHNSASLNSVLGDKALTDGDYENAKKYLLEAISSYQKQHKNSTTLNNEALVHYSLFGLDGDVKHINNTTRLLEEAVSLSPNSSIIIRNAYLYMMIKSFCDVVPSQTDFKNFQEQLTSRVLKFFYSDHKSKQAIIQKLKQNPTFVKAMSYMKKSMILSPESIDTYSTAAKMYYILKDHEDMHALLTQLRSIQKYLPPQTYNSSGLSPYVNVFKQQIAHYKNLANSQNPVTIALAQANYLHYSLLAVQCGIEVNHQDLQKLAEQLYAKYPSQAARQNLINSHLLQVHMTMLQNKDYKEHIAKYSQHISHQHLIAVALRNYPQLKSLILANKDFIKAMQLLQKSSQEFPKATKVLDWILISSADQQQENAMLQNLKSSHLHSAFQEINTVLSPVSMPVLLESYWFYEVTGQKERAQQIVNDYQKRGVPFLK